MTETTIYRADEDISQDAGSDDAVSGEETAPVENGPERNGPHPHPPGFTISINIGNGNGNGNGNPLNETTIRRRRISRENRESRIDPPTTPDSPISPGAPISLPLQSQTQNRFTVINTFGGTRRVHVHRIHNGGRGHFRISTSGTGRPPRMQQQQFPRMSLPPLLPQPLPHTSSSSYETNNSNGTVSSEDDKADFKCLICFEFLHEPASCGKCNSRFCLACISRVAEMGGNGSPPKCPTCRCEFHPSDIQRDLELQGQILRADSIPCQYEGCSTHLLLRQVASHEATCLFVPLMCRYSSFGCTWKGLRKDLTEHESACPLMHVSSLVEQFRQARADHENALSHVQTRVAASNAMMELHASLIRRLHKRLYHPGDLLDLVYSLTCTPARFIYTKDIWRSMHVCRLARGAICNMLTFLPITLLVLRITVTMFREILHLEIAWENGGLHYAGLIILMVVLILWLWIFMIMCFALDGKTSVEWDERPRRWKCVPLWKDWCAMASWALFVCTLAFDGGGIKATVVWFLVCTCTAYFPSHIITMLESCNGVNQTVPTNVFVAGRAVPIVLFGMRHALMTNMMGILPWLDAVLLQVVLRKFQPERMEPFIVKDDCFFTNINTEILVGYASGSVAITLLEWNTLDRLFKTLEALLLLLVVNHLMNKLIILGDVVAKLIFNKAMEDLLPNQSGVRKEYNTTGVIAFCTWTIFLVFILLSF